MGCFDRTTKTVLASVIVLVLLAGARSDAVMKRRLPDTFWAQKLLWGPEFDVVVGGDSRVYRGVSPGAMQEFLPRRRIANFGFSSCGFTSSYLDAVESLLDPQSREETIVLGVTAHTLTPEAAKDNHFLRLARKKRFELLQMAWLGQVAWFFSPYGAEELADLFGEETAGYSSVWHADGWVASRKTPEDPTEAVRAYRRHAKRLKSRARVSDRIVKRFLQRVARWRDQGVRVYGFRPPIVPELAEVERRDMGFDETAFVRQFESAGGVWLAFQAGRYHSYDGSHLRDDAAVTFSKDLAAALVERRPVRQAIEAPSSSRTEAAPARPSS
jgi:hypothetical protein